MSSTQLQRPNEPLKQTGAACLLFVDHTSLSGPKLLSLVVEAVEKTNLLASISPASGFREISGMIRLSG